jgi:hypothetical protein
MAAGGAGGRSGNGDHLWIEGEGEERKGEERGG